MARKRMIDPSFWVDEKLGTVDPMVRLLFMGLISQADDEGRLNGHPALLRSLIFPYDHNVTIDNVSEWLELLSSAERKLIIQYEVDHQKYIMITNFKKHQTINKPQKSKLPTPLNTNYGSPPVPIPEQEGIPTAQSKLNEASLSEEEGKLKDEGTHSHFNNPVKDRIYKYAAKCEIKNLNIVNIEDIFFFIDKLEIEVIEEALKKSHKMYLNYAVKIMNDWLNEGKVKLTLIKGGQADAKRTDGHAGRTNAELDAMSH